MKTFFPENIKKALAFNLNPKNSEIVNKLAKIDILIHELRVCFCNEMEFNKVFEVIYCSNYDILINNIELVKYHILRGEKSEKVIEYFKTR